MLLASQILLIIASIMLVIDAVLMALHRPNFVKGWPLPSPVTLIFLAVGLLIFSIAGLS